jgi:hypothetical protein
MHGIIFSELRKFVDSKMGNTGWESVMVGSGIGRKMYLPIQEYPDGDMIALVTSASKILDLPPAAILEAFGEFIAPSLLGLYRTLVKPEWKTLDLLENTEHTIHTVVRARNRGARPAQLQVVRTGPNTVDLTYHSERRLCPVAKGIIKGLAAHFQEEISITETACMHSGADACRMEVRVGAPAAARKVSASKTKKRQVMELDVVEAAPATVPGDGAEPKVSKRRVKVAVGAR